MFEEPSTQQIKRDIARLVDDVAGLRREITHKGRQSAVGLRDDAQGKLLAARKEARDRARQLDRYAHEQPWMAAGVAAALGAVLGALLAWRGRNR